ncbi:PH domain-containing protein [uncultured Winogradskyella sp.]|uniref:PH domain-containing protein n=1 Tax=uncultured Winogradskyella sp. TaxID=395353 RepID=UPI00262A8939|nr:PH domain-containing protein [uncultured Winogradskyella sp.]
MALFSNIQIDVESLPKSDQLVLVPISHTYFKIIILNCIIAYAVLIGALSIFNIFSEDYIINSLFWFLLGFLVVLFFISLGFGYLSFKKRKYAFREEDITSSQGYLVHKIVTLPYNRIQHIEITRTFIARKLGLSTLKIYSAGESGGDVAIKGLPKAVAENQYAFLTKIINERL